jgi:site-specific DNA-cytosine methylase
MTYNADNPLTVVELFAGYGSQRMALERLKHDNPGFDYKVLAVSEIEPAALRAYEAVHGDCPNLGDVSKVEWVKHPELKGVHLLTYSFPCTSVSSAGRQDTGGRLVENRAVQARGQFDSGQLSLPPFPHDAHARTAGESTRAATLNILKPQKPNSNTQ